MKKLFLIRHGLSVGNVDGVFAGSLDTPLSSTGQDQAKDAGKKIKGDGHIFDLIVASPLIRTQHTAQSIAKEIGYPIDKILTNPLFIERGFGVLEGTPEADFKKDHTIEHLDQVEGSETLEQLHKRAERALKYLKARQEENILVVSHGSFGRALRRVIQGLPHTHEYSPENTRIGNCEIVELI